jgi:hypothetical protein
MLWWSNRSFVIYTWLYLMNQFTSTGNNFFFKVMKVWHSISTLVKLSEIFTKTHKNGCVCKLVLFPSVIYFCSKTLKRKKWFTTWISYDPLFSFFWQTKNDHGSRHFGWIIKFKFKILLNNTVCDNYTNYTNTKNVNM